METERTPTNATSRGLILETSDKSYQYELLMRAITLITKRDYSFEFLDPAEITNKWILDTLVGNAYDWIMYRLTIGFQSLRIPEAAHWLNSPTRILAYTAADTDRHDMLRLFDAYLRKGDSIEVVADQFESCLAASPGRLSSQTEIDDALSVILKSAGCYGNSGNFRHGGSASLDEYRKAVGTSFAPEHTAQGSVANSGSMAESGDAVHLSCEYDVFLSHSSKDKRAVRDLADRLTRDGLRVWMDDLVIQPGDSIPLAIEKGLQNSMTLVLVMSQNAFGSEWVALERHSALFRDPLNQQRRFVPLRLDDCEITDAFKQFAYIDWRQRDEVEYEKLVHICTQHWRVTQPGVDNRDEVPPARSAESELRDKLETSTADIGLSSTMTDHLQASRIFTVRNLLECTRDELLDKAGLVEADLEQIQQVLMDLIFGKQPRVNIIEVSNSTLPETGIGREGP